MPILRLAKPLSVIGLLIGSAGIGFASGAGAQPNFQIDPIVDNAPYCVAPLESMEAGTNQFSACLQGDVSRGVKFNFSDLSTDMGVFDVRGGAVTRATTGAMTIERMIGTNYQLQQNNSTALFGVTSHLLDGRLTISSDIASSDDLFEMPTNQARSFAAGSSAFERSGLARWSHIEAQVLNSSALQWSVSGDFSQIDAGYFTSLNGLPQVGAAMPGTRSFVSTTIKSAGTRIAFGMDNYAGPFGAVETDKVTVAYGSITLAATTKDAVVPSFSNPALLASRTTLHGFVLDFPMDELLPASLENMEAIKQLLPTQVSIGLTQGRTENLLTAVGRFSRSSIDASMSWDSIVGETTLMYWQQSKGGYSAAQGNKADQFVDVSHAISWRSWRFGVDGYLTQSLAAGTSGSADTSLSGSVSVTYQQLNGPSFKFRLGRDNDQFRMIDDSYLSSEKSFNLAMSLDLSGYVQRTLNRPDAHLEFELRKALDHVSEITPVPGQDPYEFLQQQGGQGLLISFGMSL